MKDSIDLELHLGITWQSKAKSDYDLYASVVEDGGKTLPNWDELSPVEQLAWELPARDTEASINGVNYGIDKWKEFARRRLKK